MKKLAFQSLFGLLAITIFLLFNFSNNVHAQSSVTPTTTPSATPTITPNPTVVALQNIVATQQVDIQDLQRNLQYEVRDMRWWFLVAGVIATILGALGYQTYKSIDEQIKGKIRRIITKYLYQLDLTNLDVYVSSRLSEGEYKKHNLEEILKSQGIQVKWFDQIPTRQALQGITILPIENAQDENAFLKYIERNGLNLNPKKAGFILYASTPYRLKQDTLSQYSTTVVANTAWSLASILITLGRSLTPLPKYDELND